MTTAALLVVLLGAGEADAGVSLQPPEVAALAQLTDAGTPAIDVNAPHPADPFSHEYVPPAEKEVGAGRGQLRLYAIGGLTSAPDLLGEITAESMHLSFFSVRGAVTAELTNLGAPHPHLLTARLGFALHVAPYRRVNASLFVDAGLAVADLFTSQRRAAPLLVPGAAFEVALTAHLFIRAEGLFFWSVLPSSGPLTRWAGLLGLGWTL